MNSSSDDDFISDKENRRLSGSHHKSSSHKSSISLDHKSSKQKSSSSHHKSSSSSHKSKERAKHKDKKKDNVGDERSRVESSSSSQISSKKRVSHEGAETLSEKQPLHLRKPSQKTPTQAMMDRNKKPQQMIEKRMTEMSGRSWRRTLHTGGHQHGRGREQQEEEEGAVWQLYHVSQSGQDSRLSSMSKLSQSETIWRSGQIEAGLHQETVCCVGEDQKEM